MRWHQTGPDGQTERSEDGRWIIMPVQEDDRYVWEVYDLSKAGAEALTHPSPDAAKAWIKEHAPTDETERIEA